MAVKISDYPIQSFDDDWGANPQDGNAQSVEQMRVFLRDKLSAEATARQNADSALQTELAKKASTDTVSTLQSDINAEATARQADTIDVRHAIDTEKLERQNADTAIRTTLDTKSDKSSTPTVIDLLDYMNEDLNLPTTKAVFVYNNCSTYHRMIRLTTDESFRNGDEAHHLIAGHYLVFMAERNFGTGQFIGYNRCLIYLLHGEPFNQDVSYGLVTNLDLNDRQTELPPSIKRAFGLAEATTTYSGLMSTIDKVKVDKIDTIESTANSNHDLAVRMMLYMLGMHMKSVKDLYTENSDGTVTIKYDKDILVLFDNTIFKTLCAEEVTYPPLTQKELQTVGAVIGSMCIGCPLGNHFGIYDIVSASVINPIEVTTPILMDYNIQTYDEGYGINRYSGGRLLETRVQAVKIFDTDTADGLAEDFEQICTLDDLVGDDAEEYWEILKQYKE